MNFKSKSLRAFIGAKNFSESRSFYKDLGFTEISISNDMSLFKVNDALSFYLQDYYVKGWVDNSMLFLEVDDVAACLIELKSKELHLKYTKVRFTDIKYNDWGKEFFMHDPSGILWHFGSFNGS